MLLQYPIKANATDTLSFACIDNNCYITRIPHTCKEYVLDDYWMSMNLRAIDVKAKLGYVVISARGLSQRLTTLKNFIHKWEDHLGINKSTFEPTENGPNLMVVHFDKEWYRFPQRLSLYLWLLRVGYKIDPAKEVTTENLFDVVRSASRNVPGDYNPDAWHWANGRHRLKYICEKKSFHLFQHKKWKQYSSCGQVHAYGGWVNGPVKPFFSKLG